MRIIIAGSRVFNDYETLKRKVDHLLSNTNEITIEIVSGTAKGTDRLGERYAEEKGYKITRFPADWNTYGKSAGYIRNKQMAEYGELLIAFWDGESKGTKMMIELAKESNVNTIIVKYAWDELMGKAIVTSYSNQLNPAQ